MGATQLKTIDVSANTRADLEVGRETLRLEANALLTLATSLGESFSATLDLIQPLKGRVIVTGMGKAGHVGKKVTATLASTGTRAYFVHPAEASHGDLGMVGEDDLVLALSKSGESAELRDIVNYCKRFSIPLVAMTQNCNSTLAKQADVILDLGNSPEACPNQQAPTTSTTLMMAMGDALAVALMKRRGFSANDFRQYHPGGKLGGQLLAVRKVMKQGNELPLVPATATVAQARAIMSEKNFGCAIITTQTGELAGFMTDGDIRRHLSPALAEENVSTIMAKTPYVIEVSALAAAALAMMNQHEVTQLVVVDGTTPVGLIRMHDILRAGVA